MDNGSLLGLTWGLMAGYVGYRFIYNVGFALYCDERWHEYEERDKRIKEFQQRMSSELFEAMKHAGIIEEIEERETVH